MTKVLSLLLRELGEVWPPAGLLGERPGVLLLGVVGLLGERPGVLLLGVVGLWGERPGVLLVGVSGLSEEPPGLLLVGVSGLSEEPPGLLLFGSTLLGAPGTVGSSAALSASSKTRSRESLKPLVWRFNSANPGTAIKELTPAIPATVTNFLNKLLRLSEVMNF